MHVYRLVLKINDLDFSSDPIHSELEPIEFIRSRTWDGWARDAEKYLNRLEEYKIPEDGLPLGKWRTV